MSGERHGYGEVQSGAHGLVTRDGVPGLSYISQEAASEVAMAEAAGDLRTGNVIRIEVVGEPTTVLGDETPLSVVERPAVS